MKHILAILFVLVFVFSYSASVTIPAEVKSFMLHFYSEYTLAAEAIINAVEKTDDPVALAEALNFYADKIEPLMPRLAELEEEYKDFFDSVEDLDDDEIGDPDIDKAAEEFEKYEEQMVHAMMRIFQHYEHPDIKSAMERIENLMDTYDDDM